MSQFDFNYFVVKKDLKKKLPQENLEKTLREFFGISQQDFATYLSVSRSMLSMVEVGERELPGAASVKLATLVSLVYGKGGLAEQPIELPPLTAAEKKMLAQKAADCEWEAEKLRRQLTAMKEVYAQALRALALCTKMLPNTPADEQHKRERLTLEIIQDEAEKKIRNNSPGAQALLQWKIDGLVNGAERAKEILAL